MQGGGVYVQYPLETVGRLAARLLDQEGHRVRLIHQAQLGLRVAGPVVGGIEEDAAALHDAVHVRHHRGGPAHIIILGARPLGAEQPLFDIAGDGGRPLPTARHVDREFAIALRHLQRPVGHLPGADLAIEREFVDAGANAKHQQRLRPVDRIARGDLIIARLQEILFAHIAPFDILRRAQHREDGADRKIDVDIAGPVDRIEQQQIFALGVAIGDKMDRLHLLGAHGRQMPAPFIRLQQQLIGDDVELLLHLALHILAVEAAQHLAQRALRHRMADRLARARHRLDQQAQFGGQGIGMSLLFDEKPGQRGAGHEKSIPLKFES